MLYCKVENNTPQPPAPLPQVINGTVSNVAGLPDSELASWGFYPFIQTIQPDYNPATHRVVQELQFTGTQVNQVWTVVALTVAEMAANQAALVQRYEDALYAFQDEMAGRKGYRNCDRCINYYNSTNAAWAKDAQDLSNWRDSTVVKSFEIMGKVQAGLMPLPSIPDFLAMMPPLWPDPNAPATGGGGNSNGTLSS